MFKLDSTDRRAFLDTELDSELEIQTEGIVTGTGDPNSVPASIGQCLYSVHFVESIMTKNGIYSGNNKWLLCEPAQDSILILKN